MARPTEHPRDIAAEAVFKHISLEIARVFDMPMIHRLGPAEGMSAVTSGIVLALACTALAGAKPTEEAHRDICNGLAGILPEVFEIARARLDLPPLPEVN